MRILRIIARTLKGLYDILATYFLAWILLLAAAAFGVHMGLEAVAGAAGFDGIEVLWRRLEGAVGATATLWIRLAAFGALHAGLIYLLRHPLARIGRTAERLFDGMVALFDRLTRDNPRVKIAVQAGFSLVVTLLLVPFVLQPTLVPGFASSSAWVERAANLVDGTASHFVADSVVGLYGRLYTDPVKAQGGVTEAEVDADTHASDAAAGLAPDERPELSPTPVPTGAEPLMDRWDGHIERTAGGDRRRFAYIKAFMWVESAGRQFAVSTTGCSGLMQFCAGTARSRPYRKIFGTGRVHTCQCDGRCKIDRAISRGLETGATSPDQIDDQFPCDLTDARFDPQRSIRAGAAYIDRLHRRFDGNIHLMYIGYNSGPAVAGDVYARLDHNGDATLDEIELHLADAMRPHYGSGSKARARSLTRTHLPKIQRAYERYSTTTIASR
ncbi:MAG: lytic transglycosylase domain-containing protein [Myxococcota bacterium]